MKAKSAPKSSGAFHDFSRASAKATGHPVSFGLALVVILAWGVTGPIFHFSDTWQLVINTGTTIVTFLMVFLIQNTQNRDSEAMQLKLDELIRSSATAHNAVLDVEELSERDLDTLKSKFEELAARARKDVRAGKSDLGCPEEKGMNPEGRNPKKAENGKCEKRRQGGNLRGDGGRIGS